jgi:UDP-2-acetamido-3-amino-2,3-dideoxy-glucuronate N-acetyltransferase
MEFKIHDTAIVDKGAIIGKNTRIWHWVHICRGAVIGQNVSLGQNVFVGAGAKIGNNCKVQNNVSIYDGVIIDDDVFCGPSVVFTNVRNPRAFIERKTEYENTHINKGVTLGANCTIVCGVSIGEYAFIGAGATITKDIDPFVLAVGNPAISIGWMSKFGEKLPFVLGDEGQYKCPNSGEIYTLNNGKITCQN